MLKILSALVVASLLSISTANSAITFTNTPATGWQLTNAGTYSNGNDVPAVASVTNDGNGVLAVATHGSCYPNPPSFAAQTPSLPNVTGETEIGSGVRRVGTNHTIELHGFTAKLTGSPTDFNWDEATGGDRRVMGFHLALTGHDTTTPLRAAATNQGVGTTVTFPDTSNARDGDFVLRIAYVGKEDTAQTFSGVTGVTDIVSDPQPYNYVCGFYAGYEMKSGAGAPGTRTMTLNTTRDWVAVTYVIAVADADPPCERFISTTGNNGNDGQSPGTAWAISALSSNPDVGGRVVCLENGTYVITTEPGHALASGQMVAYGGTNGDPTVVRATNPRQAIITGYNGSSYITADGPGAGGGIIGTSQSYVTFRNLVVTGGVAKGITLSSEGSPPTGQRVEGCEIYDFDGARRTDGKWTGNDNVNGIRIENANNVVIYNNKIHDIAGGATGSGQTTWGQINSTPIMIYDADGTVIEQNTLYNSFAAIYNKNGGAINTVIRYNHVYNMGAAIRFGGVNTYFTNYISEVSHNVFERIHNFHAEVGGEDELYATQVFKNNTILPIGNSWTSEGVMWSSTTIAGAMHFYNNIIWRTGGSGGEYGDLGLRTGIASDLGSSSPFNYNNYGSSFVWRIAGSTYSTISDWQMASGKDSNSITSNPNFVDSSGASGAAGFKLQSGSLAINLGRDDGTSSGAAVNAGAYASSGQTEQIGAAW